MLWPCPVKRPQQQKKCCHNIVVRGGPGGVVKRSQHRLTTNVVRMLWQMCCDRLIGPWRLSLRRVRTVSIQRMFKRFRKRWYASVTTNPSTFQMRFLDCEQYPIYTGVTVIWVPPCFGYPRTQIPIDMGIPFQYGCRVSGLPRYPLLWVPLKDAKIHGKYRNSLAKFSSMLKAKSICSDMYIAFIELPVGHFTPLRRRLGD